MADSTLDSTDRHQGRRRLSQAMFVSAVAVACLGLGYLIVFAPHVAGMRSNASSAPSETMPSPERIKEEGERIDRIMAEGGWAPYHGLPSGPDVVVPVGAWIRITPGMEGLEASASKGLPVAMNPDGEVLGYDFAYVGFVPRPVVEDPAFDPASLRVKKFGCDPVGHQDCMPFPAPEGQSR